MRSRGAERIFESSYGGLNCPGISWRERFAMGWRYPPAKKGDAFFNRLSPATRTDR